MQGIHNIYNSFNNNMWIHAINRDYEKGKKSRFMKRNLRFYFALLFAKGTALVLKLIGRKGTSMPGSWAIILCPDFLGRMPRPKTVIGITGTNGKTTVSNLVEDVLAQVLKEEACFSRKALAVNGRDIMALGVPQGRQVGEVLHKLLQCVLEGRLPNERQALLAYAKGLVP